jgi:DNA repair protein RAD5
MWHFRSGTLSEEVIVDASFQSIASNAFISDFFFFLFPSNISVYLPNPAAFFAIFDEVRASSSTASSTSASLFFAKKAAGKRPKLEALPEAAFSLLQWAQQGETFDFETQKAEDSSNDSEEEMVVQAEEELDATNDNEDTVPEWAQSIAAATENRKSLPEMEGPVTVKVDLRPYQRQALHWMVQCEKEADTKDLEEQLKLLSELAADQSAFLEPPPDTRIHCECGPVLVSQDEAASCTAVNGDTRTTSHPLWQRRYLASYDQKETKCFYVQPLFGVATAYPPQPPQPCRGGILADSMGLGKTVMLLALICQSKEQEEKDKHGTTLVVAPLSLLAQWERELETKTSLSYCVHYGDKKLDDYNGVDVVVTTYGSLQGELQGHMKKRQANADLEFSGLLGFGWKRVILDEAHCIKNAATGASKACCILQAERRWCVSGTIIQNSLDDAFALLKFLRHEPWCEHGFWKAAIGKVEDREVALDRVKRVLQPIMLRRTKETLDKDG